MRIGIDVSPMGERNHVYDIDSLEINNKNYNNYYFKLLKYKLNSFFPFIFDIHCLYVLY